MNMLSVARIAACLCVFAGMLSPQIASAKPTVEQKCQAGKNIAVGKLATCLQAAEAKLAITGDATKYARTKLDCSYRFAKRWVKLEESAARAGGTCRDAPLDQGALAAAIHQCSASVASALAGGGLLDCSASLSTCVADLGTSQAARAMCETSLSTAMGNLANCQTALAACSMVTPTPTPTGIPTKTATATPTPMPTSTPPRYIDNGDGTVTDTQTGLQWEKKTSAVGSGANYGDPHDVDNIYSWSATGTAPDGTVFTQFLAGLNTPPCFAGHCDWRLPRVNRDGDPAELETMLLTPYPCATIPCIDPIFGPTAAILGVNLYWSATTNATFPIYAWYVNFNNGDVTYLTKQNESDNVRAVRGP